MLFFTYLVFLCSSRLIILNKRLPTSDFRLPTRDFLLPTSELRSRTSDFGFRALGLGISTPAILIAVIKKVDEEESCKLSSIRFSPEIYSCLLCEYFGKGYPFWILCTSAHYYTWTQLYNWIHSIDKEIRKLNSKRRRENNKTFWSPKSDVESRKLDVGSPKSDVGSRKSLLKQSRAATSVNKSHILSLPKINSYIMLIHFLNFDQPCFRFSLESCRLEDNYVKWLFFLLGNDCKVLNIEDSRKWRKIHFRHLLMKYKTVYRFCFIVWTLLTLSYRYENAMISKS